MPSTVTRSLALFAFAAAGALYAGEHEDGLSFIVYGASGKVGSHVVEEALARGHRVTAVSRDPARITRTHENLQAVRGDILDKAGVSSLLAGHDLVVVSVRGVTGDGSDPSQAVALAGLNNVVEALRESGNGTTRVLHVGGAGSLEIEPGVLLADRLPALFMPRSLETEVAAQIEALEYLRGVDDVSWTYVTPPRTFTSGRRTGDYRIGGNRLLEDRNGRSRISRADFAVALVDEAENGVYGNRRMSVAY